MRKQFAIVAAFIMLAFSSCTKIEGELISQDFNVDGAYTELEVSNAFEVTVSDAADCITVTAGENVMPKVVVEIVHNTLKIYLKPLTIASISNLRVTLPYNPDLTSVDLSGASGFHSEFPLRGEKVEVELSGASNFYDDIEAEVIEMDLSGASNVFGGIYGDHLYIEASGASDVKLEGYTTTLNVELSGASNIKKNIVGDHYSLVCESCRGDISGASGAYIHCDGEISVALSGASDLHYTGDATTDGCSLSGSSNIVHDKL